MHDVIVIGGGAMGSSAARALARAGRDVLLLERFWPGHARGGSHGRSRIFRLVYEQADYVRLARRSLQAWRDLESETGERLLTVTGAVDHGLTEPELAARTAILRIQGVPFEVLDPAEATRRWPGMKFEELVLHQRDGGRLRADRALEVLQRQAIMGGAQIHYGRPVTGLAFRRDIIEVRAGDETMQARHVVVAAGPWTPALLSGVVDLPQLTVTQEQPSHFAVRGNLEWPSFVHWRPGAAASYGLRAPGEGIKVGFHASGPIVDPEERDFTAQDHGLRALRAYVKRWLPGADPDTAEPVSCLLDSTDNYDFVIDTTGQVTVAMGFSGHGFTFAPVVGELVANLAAGGTAHRRFALAAHG